MAALGLVVVVVLYDDYCLKSTFKLRILGVVLLEN